jgi:integrase
MARGKGEGSIYQRNDGTWEAKLSLGTTPDGRRIRKSVYGDTKAAVLEALARARFESGQGYPDGEKLTVARFLEMWLRDHVDSHTRPNTRKSYRYTVSQYLNPAIGALRLSELRPTSMDGLRAAMKTAKVPPASAFYACVVFKGAIRWAAEKEVIKAYPFHATRLQRPVRPKMKTWSSEQALAFLANREEAGDRLWAFYVTALATGLRHGELLALRWEDLDFQARTVSVKHNLLEYRENGRTCFALQPVKTEAGEATLHLPPFAVAALARHRLEHGAGSEFVFMTTTGTHYMKTNVTFAFRQAVEAMGLKMIRIHDLRHTCATLLLESGQSIKEIQAQLRHGDAGTTANTYAHVTEKMKKGTADVMQGIMSAKETK